MPRILGIDPGSRVTGFGIIDVTGNRSRYVTSGYLAVAGDQIADRLHMIFQRLRAVVGEYQPDEAAIEKVFLHRNFDAALKLGQARGAALCAAAEGAMPVAEYSPREIKKAIVGKGNAAKDQVQHMIRVLLCLDRKPQSDEADALAVALCHGHIRQTLRHLPEVRVVRGGRLR